MLTYIGMGHGDLPGQFKSLMGVAIDKQNRVFTTEQLPGRLQVFQYVTDDQEAAAKRRAGKRRQWRSTSRLLQAANRPIQRSKR